MTVKVGCSNADARHAAENERRISDGLGADMKHCGTRRIRRVIDSFELSGKHLGQNHLCLVHDAMREPLSFLQHRFEGKYPDFYVKYVVRFMLEALEYMHETCHVIHTGKYSTWLCFGDNSDNFVRRY